MKFADFLDFIVFCLFEDPVGGRERKGREARKERKGREGYYAFLNYIFK